MAFTYRDMGPVFQEYILRILCNGWMDCRDAFRAVLSLYCAEYEVYWLMGFPIINIWGAHFASKFSIFPVMAGWIAGILLCCSLLILLCNKHNKAEYEAYWLISVPIINP